MGNLRNESRSVAECHCKLASKFTNMRFCQRSSHVVSLASQAHKHCEEKGQAHVSLHQPAERVQDQPEAADLRHATS